MTLSRRCTTQSLPQSASRSERRLGASGAQPSGIVASPPGLLTTSSTSSLYKISISTIATLRAPDRARDDMPVVSSVTKPIDKKKYQHPLPRMSAAWRMTDARTVPVRQRQTQAQSRAIPQPCKPLPRSTQTQSFATLLSIPPITANCHRKIV